MVSVPVLSMLSLHFRYVNYWYFSPRLRHGTMVHCQQVFRVEILITRFMSHPHDRTRRLRFECMNI